PIAREGEALWGAHRWRLNHRALEGAARVELLNHRARAPAHEQRAAGTEHHALGAAELGSRGKDTEVRSIGSEAHDGAGVAGAHVEVAAGVEHHRVRTV